MEAIDLMLEDRLFQSNSLSQCGVTSENVSCLKDLVSLLGFGRATLSRIPVAPYGGSRYELSQCLTSLLKLGTLSEVIGAGSLKGRAVAHYSTFVTKQPRSYFNTYCGLMREIRSQTNLPSTVWLEDVACLSRFGWSTNEAQDAATVTHEWFQKQDPSLNIMLSSEYEAGKIPLDFIERILSNISMEEFLGMLPFHKRHSSLILVSDVCHCIWSTYIFSRFSGLHLAGATNKRNCMIYRKHCGKEHTIALLPVTT